MKVLVLGESHAHTFDHMNTRQKEYTRPSPYDIHLKFETCYKHWLAEFEIATGKKIEWENEKL